MRYTLNPFTGNLSPVGVGSVAGADTQIQFNDGGSFGADSDFTWDKTLNILGVKNQIKFEGDTGVYVNNTTLYENIVLGDAPIPSSRYNTIVGVGAGGSNTVGFFRNNLFGYKAGEDMTTASDNQVMGNFALSNLIDGDGDVVMGNQAMGGPNTKNASYTIALGYQAGFNANTDYCIFLGNKAGYFHDTVGGGRDYTLIIGDTYGAGAGQDPLVYGELDNMKLIFNCAADFAQLKTQPTGGTDLAIATTKYVNDAVSTENLWDRTGAILSPHNANDSVQIAHSTTSAYDPALGISYTNTKTTGNEAYAVDISCIQTNAVSGGDPNLLCGQFINVVKSGADTDTYQADVFGQWIQAQYTGATNVGTRNTYGLYCHAYGDTAGTSTVYGLHVGASGGDTNNSIYSSSGTVDLRMAGANALKVINTSNPWATGFAYIYGVASQSDTCALYMAHHEALTTGTVTHYGAKFFTNEDAVKTSGDHTHIGLFSESYFDRAHTSAGTLTVYGGQLLGKQTGSTDAGTRDTYGGYCSAEGDSNGASTAYGLYTTATGADTNWGLYVAAGDTYIAGALSMAGTLGISGTMTIDDGANWRFTLTFVNGILTAQTTAASSGATASWA